MGGIWCPPYWPAGCATVPPEVCAVARLTDIMSNMYTFMLNTCIYVYSWFPKEEAMHRRRGGWHPEHQHHRLRACLRHHRGPGKEGSEDQTASKLEGKGARSAAFFREPSFWMVLVAFEGLKSKHVGRHGSFTQGLSFFAYQMPSLSLPSGDPIYLGATHARP